ncbi:N-acetyltransferase GCN5 [Streptomyces sulfonofaciens]|uniref:N-acetyltransferase GCN5 n=1 Tax=Streptomyces sulfonofaciens TaxID=68272 RepID=A0A919FYA7_9ACTN|nr:GNAT family N-acetyltransferase [Streptomyces sulfonofaciens]GHH74056.1 N-acetyltransferase GCN5 [Streptomyces sulfonofaciens]
MTAPPARFTVTRATPDEWAVVGGWAADEGWDPGRSDAAAFFAQDPEGFHLGRRDGEPVSAVSVVRYGPDYAFLGFYLVRPDQRGRGFGLATWQAALAGAGRRTVGLDGVVAQQDNYRRSGFTPSHRTHRYTGPAPGCAPEPAGIVPAATVGTEAITAYDSACHPADRPRFLARWLTTPGHRALARVTDGRLTGYGVLRPAHSSYRIGPLFADTPADARALFDALTAGTGRTPVTLDVPESNPAAVAMAEELGLAPSFETARMYTGPIRPLADQRVFGITTLELG